MKRLPWKKFQGSDLNGMINSLSTVFELDFQTVVSEHSQAGTRAVLREFLNDLVDLSKAVRQLKNQSVPPIPAH